MATIYPRYVNSMEELKQAVNSFRTVIIVTNPDMIPEVKKRVKKDNRASTVTTLLAGASGLGVGGFVFGSVALGAGLFLAGTAALTVGAVKSLFDVCLHDLLCYRYTEFSPGTVLILIKRKGSNKFDEKRDHIEFKKKEAE